MPRRNRPKKRSCYMCGEPAKLSVNRTDVSQKGSKWTPGGGRVQQEDASSFMAPVCPRHADLLEQAMS